MYVHYVGTLSASTTLSRAYTIFTICAPKKWHFPKNWSEKKTKQNKRHLVVRWSKLQPTNLLRDLHRNEHNSQRACGYRTNIRPTDRPTGAPPLHAVRLGYFGWKWNHRANSKWKNDTFFRTQNYNHFGSTRVLKNCKEGTVLI